MVLQDSIYAQKTESPEEAVDLSEVNRTGFSGNCIQAASGGW